MGRKCLVTCECVDSCEWLDICDEKIGGVSLSKVFIIGAFVPVVDLEALGVRWVWKDEQVLLLTLVFVVQCVRVLGGRKEKGYCERSQGR